MIVVSPEWRQRAFIRDFVYARGILPRHQSLVGGWPILLRSQLQEVTAIHQLVDHLVQVPVEFLTKDLLRSFLLLSYGTVYVRRYACFDYYNIILYTHPQLFVLNRQNALCLWAREYNNNIIRHDQRLLGHPTSRAIWLPIHFLSGRCLNHTKPLLLLHYIAS